MVYCDGGYSCTEFKERSCYQEGCQDGYEKGLNDGYQRGYDVGYHEGYDRGYREGYKTGYDKGYNDGYQKGYKDGYNAGYKKRQAEVTAFLRERLEELLDLEHTGHERVAKIVATTFALSSEMDRGKRTVLEHILARSLKGDLRSAKLIRGVARRWGVLG